MIRVHFMHKISTIVRDLEKFIRTEKDIPFMLKDKILEYLKEKGWEPRKEIPQEPTLLY